jgi:hypothetical protein
VVAALLLLAYVVLALSIVLAVVIGLFRGRRNLRWKTPGYNIFTGVWTDESDQNEKGAK